MDPYNMYNPHGQAPGLEAHLPATESSYGNDDLDALSELLHNDSFPCQDGTAANAPTVILPDSPPYTGSEPYSPDSNKLLSPSSSDVSSQSGYRTGPSPDPHHNQYSPDTMINQQQQQLLQNHLLQQQQQLQQYQQQQLQLQHRLQQQNMPAGPMLGHAGVHMPIPQVLSHEDHFISNSPYAKKRRLPEDSSPEAYLQQGMPTPRPSLQVKQEPAAPPCTYDDNSSLDISPSMLNGGSYQPIKWKEFDKSTWCPAINAQGQRVNVQTYRLDGDKGFNYSQVDKAFVCQKKNHFQITGCFVLSDAPQYVITSEGPKPIEGIYVHFYGVKEEATNQIIQVDQSQADRSKKKFCPLHLQPNGENSWKITVGRLHFSDTTLNNMRKRGKPNPDQRYFLLVVGVYAHSQGKEYPLIQQSSEKLIVRASNPGQFQDSEAEPVKWQPGQTSNSVFHSGKVGINTDSPDEALTVAGNVKVMGTIMQPSDERVKENIVPTDTSRQLDNLRAIRLYEYKYKDEFANAMGLDDPDTVETGVLAQELETVIPEAVKTTSDVTLANGDVVQNLKVVDKNRLFMESLGAVKELSNITTSLEGKITYLERFNSKLKKLKRIGSLRSTASDVSHLTSVSTVSHVTVHRKKAAGKFTDSEKDSVKDLKQGGICSNRFLQVLIFVLVFVMVACVGVILAMLLMDKHKTTSNEKSVGSVKDGLTGGDPTADPNPLGGSTTKPGGSDCFYPGELLIGKNCDLYTQNCRVDTCTNVCDNLLEPGKPSPSPGKPFKFSMGAPGSDSVIYDPFPPKDSDSVSSRKKRDIDEGLLTDVSIGISSPVSYTVTGDNCLNCYGPANTYTYGVQVHKTFVGTAGTLKIAANSLDTWTTLLVCPPVEFPEAGLKCEDGLKNAMDIVITPVITKAYSLTKTVNLNVDLGIDTTSIFVFRLTNKQIQSAEAACQERLSPDMKEIKLAFIRRCDSCPMSADAALEYITERLHR